MKGEGSTGNRAICETMPIRANGADRQMPLNRVLRCKSLKSLIRILFLCLAHLLIDDITELDFQNAWKIIS
jgi:hypothetical protein